MHEARMTVSRALWLHAGSDDLDGTSVEPLSGLAPPAASVIAPSALTLGKPAIEIFGAHRPMVGQRVFPTGAGDPSDQDSGTPWPCPCREARRHRYSSPCS